VQAWVSPEERLARPPPGQFGLSGRGIIATVAAATGVADGGAFRCEWEQRQARSLRVRAEQPFLPPLLTRVGRLALHVDPDRKNDNYAATGYVGVDLEYRDASVQGTAGGRECPYTVTHDHGLKGRFATAEQAAVHYARLEAGLPV